MLQTFWFYFSFICFCMFQVPKGMLQTDLPNTAYLRCPTWFQVPKGMLQTTKNYWRVRAWYYVSSPQGNATNNVAEGHLREYLYSFKSPRECYKQDPNTAYLRCPTWFQVPKGMLQTTCLCISPPSSGVSFKSPRECYKLRWSCNTACSNKQVSSPQGNATNSRQTSYHLSQGKGVSSPQGNATNARMDN